MGQATVDLPDPLQNTGPAEGASADDLLSQLAGDEIDRLLAESDNEPVSTTPATVVPEMPSPARDVEAPAPLPTAPASDATHAIGAINLDAVLETAAADHTASAERSALHAPANPKATTKDNSAVIELGDASARLPLFLRPLEWLSAPLDPWPDQIREIIGKIGLMTLINALAVLAYVLLFRRHHP